MILQTPQSPELMTPPPLPLCSQVEAAILTETGKEIAQGGGDEGGDGEPDDESVNPSYRDQHGISAQIIVQQVSLHTFRDL